MVRVSKGCRNGVKGCRKGVERVSKNIYIKTILNNYGKSETYMSHYARVSKQMITNFDTADTLPTPFRHLFDTPFLEDFKKINE